MAKYRNEIGSVIDIIDDKVTLIKDEINDMLTTATKLKAMLNEDEYDTDVAFDYIDGLVDELKYIWDKLKKLSDDLY